MLGSVQTHNLRLQRHEAYSLLFRSSQPRGSLRESPLLRLPLADYAEYIFQD